MLCLLFQSQGKLAESRYRECLKILTNHSTASLVDKPKLMLQTSDLCAPTNPFLAMCMVSILKKERKLCKPNRTLIVIFESYVYKKDSNL